MNPALLSSGNDNWQTPDDVLKDLNDEFNFDCDPCLVSEGLHPKDMLGSEWGTSNFVNPPYSQLAKWAKKGFDEWKKGKTVVFLVPSRTDTRYWHDYFMKATEIRFIRGRIKFKGAKNPAPFPSALVIFRKEVGE